MADQGVLEGRAHETMRLRERLDADVRVLADVGVKHSAPMGRRDSAVGPEAFGDAVERGLADGVIVGSALKAGGDATNPVSVERVERLVAAADVVR